MSTLKPFEDHFF